MGLLNWIKKSGRKEQEAAEELIQKTDKKTYDETEVTWEDDIDLLKGYSYRLRVLDISRLINETLSQLMTEYETKAMKDYILKRVIESLYRKQSFRLTRNYNYRVIVFDFDPYGTFGFSVTLDEDRIIKEYRQAMKEQE